MKDLVLLPGALGASSEFAQFLPLLEPEFNIHLYDFPGHGARVKENTDFSIPAFAEDLSYWLTAKDLKGVNLFGYSMGGYVALNLAHIQPGIVNRVATLGTKLHWTPDIAQAETKKLDPEALKIKVPQFAQTLAERHGAQSWPGIVIGTAELMRALGDAPSLHEKALSEITCPVLFGLGDSDRMVSMEETYRAFQGVKAAQLFVLPGTAHPWEKAPLPLLASALIRFFFS